VPVGNESGGDLVFAPGAARHPPGLVSQHRRPPRRDPAIPRRLQRAGAPLRVDIDRRSDLAKRTVKLFPRQCTSSAIQAGESNVPDRSMEPGALGALMWVTGPATTVVGRE